MVLRYWVKDGKATVVEDVDRLVFNSPHDFQVRRFVADRYEWNSLKFGIDYLQFTLSKE